jgi:hypothetical protein
MRDRHLAETEIQISLAGGLAVKKETGHDFDVGCYADLDRALEWAEALTAGRFAEANTYSMRLMEQAKNMLDGRSFMWEQVVAVADALLEETTLTGRRVRAIVAQVARSRA